MVGDPKIVKGSRPTDAEVRERIASIRRGAQAGWFPSLVAANYALNELHWVLGEELMEPYFETEPSGSTPGSAS